MGLRSYDDDARRHISIDSYNVLTHYAYTGYVLSVIARASDMRSPDKIPSYNAFVSGHMVSRGRVNTPGAVACAAPLEYRHGCRSAVFEMLYSTCMQALEGVHDRTAAVQACTRLPKTLTYEAITFN